MLATLAQYGDNSTTSSGAGSFAILAIVYIAILCGRLPEEQRAWYVDGGVQARTVLRKLDNPHFHRSAVQAMAAAKLLRIAFIESLLVRVVSGVWCAVGEA